MTIRGDLFENLGESTHEIVEKAAAKVNLGWTPRTVTMMACQNGIW